MEKKIRVFNYFVKKASEKVKDLMGLQDDDAALLALIFGKYSAQHRNVSGCSMETAYIVDPKLLQELFILLCLDAERHGDHLKDAFSFTSAPRYEHGRELPDIQEADISSHLNKNVYPYTGREIKKELYAKLLPKLTEEELNNALARISPVFGRKPWIHALEQPEVCAETEMIDRAWARLLEDEKFVSMLKPGGKKNYRGGSILYQNYVNDIHILL